MPQYAKWFKKMRKTKGYTQNDVAKHVGVTRETVSRWETATARPSNEIMIKLFKIYDCTNEEMLAYINPEKSQ